MSRLLDRLGARLPESALGGLPPALRARALRERVARGDGGAAVALAWARLRDPAPGVRRAAGWTVGVLASLAGPDARAALLAAAWREPCDAVRLALAVAAARAGASVSEAWAPLAHAASRVAHTFAGPRPLAAVAGAPLSAMAQRWTLALDPVGALGGHRPDPEAVVPASYVEARGRAREAVARAPEDPLALEALAEQQHPDDLDLVLADGGQGRRRALRRLVALGLHGDPRALGVLIEALRAVDVDPGYGFAARAEAATAIGRLGLPEAAPALARALEDEALDHEGRPGAGLGVQRSVRVPLLIALGEVGARDRAPLLAGYLGNVTGSAVSGFHLPAMDALVKLSAVEALRAVALRGPEDAARNAVGALELLGAEQALRAVQARAGVVGLAATEGLRRLAAGSP